MFKRVLGALVLLLILSIYAACGLENSSGNNDNTQSYAVNETTVPDTMKTGGLQADTVSADSINKLLFHNAISKSHIPNEDILAFDHTHLGTESLFLLTLNGSVDSMLNGISAHGDPLMNMFGVLVNGEVRFKKAITSVYVDDVRLIDTSLLNENIDRLTGIEYYSSPDGQLVAYLFDMTDKKVYQTDKVSDTQMLNYETTSFENKNIMAFDHDSPMDSVIINLEVIGEW